MDIIVINPHSDVRQSVRQSGLLLQGISAINHRLAETWEQNSDAATSCNV